MTIRHLEIFKMVCEQQSMTRAAEQLNMTQPAVSLAIRELEEYYHVKVFDRQGKKLFLTEPGRVLLRYTETILAQYEEAEQVLREGTIFSTCRIGMNVAAAEEDLPELLKQLKKQIPQLQLQLTVNNSKEILTLLDRNDIDLAILDENQTAASYENQLLFQEPMAAIAARKYAGPVYSKELLSQQPLLLREKGSGSRTCMDHFFAGLNIQPFMESTSALSLIETARAGLGILFLPRSQAIGLYDDSLVLLDIQAEAPIRSYYLTNVRSRYQTKTVIRVREQMIAYYKEREKG